MPSRERFDLLTHLDMEFRFALVSKGSWIYLERPPCDDARRTRL